tara:strand:+ start:131 stop:373 length:243 start_codon:yes stop_codon:yes gene_type:complete
MKVSAEVTIGNGTYDDWLKFFKSYEEERGQFVIDEVIEKTSENSALVTFEIVNLDGLTELSSRADILEIEKSMQIITVIK